MPTGERRRRCDHLTGFRVVGAAFTDQADLVQGVAVAGGDQVAVFGDQPLGGSKAAELFLGVKAVAVHGQGLVIAWRVASGRRRLKKVRREMVPLSQAGLPAEI